MDNEKCLNCSCQSCLNNAELYADGCCRDCEQCRLEYYTWYKDGVGCSYFESDCNINF